MDRCVARLQELQYTVSGGTKVISGVSLSPGSSRGYLRASLRCKQKLQGLKAQPLENLLLASFQQRQELYKFSISFDHLPNKPRASFSPAKQKKIKEACNFVCSPPLQISLETGFKGHIFHFLDVQSLDSTHHRTKPLSELRISKSKRRNKHYRSLCRRSM